MKMLNTFLFLISLLTLTSCLIDQDPKATNSSLLVARGDIAVVSVNTDSVIIFDSNGNLKRVLYQVPTAADTIAGIAWNSTTNEILITIDGTPDRIEAISILTGLSRSFYNNVAFFTGTPLSIAQLPVSGDIIASEGATIERFSTSGIRETYGAIWPTNVQANSQQISPLSTGNFIQCSSSAGVRITPDSTTSLAAVATVTGPVGATASYGCNELSDGTIVVSWAGAAADYIYTYSPTLTGPTAIINNMQSLLSDPRQIAVGENDEIYVADAARNLVVQLDASGNVIRQFGNSVLSSPRYLLVIPAITP